MVGLVIAISVARAWGYKEHAMVVLVSLLGPMDTIHTLSGIRRFAFFGVNAIFQVAIGLSSGLFTMYVMRNHRPLHFTAAMAVTCLIVVAPCAAVTFTGYSLFHGGRAPEASLLTIYGVGVLIFACMAGLVIYVLHLRLRRTVPGNAEANDGPDGSPSGPDDSQTASAVVPGTSISDADDAARHPLPTTPNAGAGDLPRFVSWDVPEESSRGDPRETEVPTAQLRLPAKIGQDVVYVHVSGHYVEVVTTAGTAIVLMRLSDIATALAGHGMQTHRSYWAAYRHIVRLQRNEHRLALHLTGGHKLPVSRSFRAAVRAFMANRDNPRTP